MGNVIPNFGVCMKKGFLTIVVFVWGRTGMNVCETDLVRRTGLVLCVGRSAASVCEVVF